MSITRIETTSVVIASVVPDRDGLRIESNGDPLTPDQARKFAKEIKRTATQFEMNQAEIVSAEIADDDFGF